MQIYKSDANDANREYISGSAICPPATLRVAKWAGRLAYHSHYLHYFIDKLFDDNFEYKDKNDTIRIHR
jgi:hypothetical protein